MTGTGLNVMNVYTTSTFTSPSATIPVVNYYCGVDLSLTGSTPSSTNKCSSNVNSTSVVANLGWYRGNSTVASVNLFYVAKTFSGDPVIKVGQTLTYKSGYSYKQTSNSTALIGTSPVTSWKIIDGAATLAITSIAGVLAVYSF